LVPDRCGGSKGLPLPKTLGLFLKITYYTTIQNENYGKSIRVMMIMQNEISLRQIIDTNLNRYKYVAKYVLCTFCFMVLLTTIISIFMFFNVVGLRWMNVVIGAVIILGFVLLCVSKTFPRISRKEIKKKPKQKDDLQQYLHIE